MIYVALLRGVNVGSKNILNMKDLVKAFEKQKYLNVRSYIQSGNIIFEFIDTSIRELERNIESMIKSTFDKRVNVIIRTNTEFKMICKRNPFVKEAGTDLNKLHITFLAEEARKHLISLLDILKGESERYSVHEKEVYLYCPNGYGKTKLNNINIEKKLGTIATTRNWNTIQQLLLMTNSIQVQ